MDELPTQIGPYLIHSVLGRGGMGVVYRAEHETSSHRVALKTVRVPRVGRLLQIRREVQALARLRHPGVVAVVDKGVAGNLPWYAMELLEGRTLADMMRVSSSLARSDDPAPTAPTLDGVDVEPLTASETKLTPFQERSHSQSRHTPDPLPVRADLPELLAVAHRIAQILEYVHGEGIVHRDVKPSNVFVTDAELPVLVDFGLATRVGDPSGRDVLEWDELTAGSARYMSPEQIRGENLDPRCDLYAFGCLLFELVTGRPPFIGSLRDVVDQHLRRPPPRVSSFVTGAPPELERLIMNLLRKDRRERTGYAHDVASTLAPWQGAAWASATPRARTYLYRPALVGRSQVLSGFEHRLRQLQIGTGGLTLIEGESGVGKTRLALEIARIASRLGIRVVASTCSSTAHEVSPAGPETYSAPLEPLRPLLRAIADDCIEAQDDTATLERVRKAAPLLAAFEPALLDVPGCVSEPQLELSAKTAHERLSRTLFEVLSAFAAQGPMLMICDDLQWCDEHTLHFLHHLATGRICELPVLVLGLLRREERSAELRSLAEAPGVQRVSLERLAPDDVAHMVAGMLSLNTVVPEFVRFLSDKSEGNALFVSEYLRIAVAEQVLVRDDDGHWSLAQSDEPTSVMCESLPLPSSLRAVLERRLAGLDALLVQLISVAATIGRSFELSLLQQAAGVTDAAVLDALAELMRRQILEAVPDTPSVRFTHDKLREISYGSLQPEQRRAAHFQVADTLEQRAGDPADIGHHWLEAGELQRSAPHLCAAAEQARRLYAHDRAIAQYRAAERVLCSLGQTEQLLQVREALGDVLCVVGALGHAREVMTLALEQAGPQHGLLRARLLRKIGKAHELAHEHEKALASYDQAEQALPKGPRDRACISEWIRIQRARIWIYYWLARVEEMNASVEALRPLIDAEASALDRSDYYHALASSSYRAHRYLVPAQAIVDARRSLAAAQEAGAPLEAAFVRFSLGFGLLFSGQLEPALSELEAALAESRRLGDTLNEVRCLAYLTLTQRRAQRVPETRSRATETLERALGANMHDYAGLARANLGWAALKLGDAQAAAVLTREAVADWSKLSFQYPFQWSGLLTLIALELERVPLRQVVASATKLLDVRLARLPASVEESLRAAIATYSGAQHAQTHEHLLQAVVHARAEGWL